MSNTTPFSILINKLVDHSFASTITNSFRQKNNQKIADKVAWISKFVLDNDYLSYKKANSLTNLSFNNNSNTSILNKYLYTIEKQKGFEQLLKKYPLLPKLIKTYCEQVQDNIHNISSLFQADKAVLEAHLNNGKPFGELVDTRIEMGDSHQGGSSTAILCFDNGKKIIYKPRSGGIDIAYNNFLTFLNKEIESLNLKTYKVIDRKQYSWVEFIEHKCCTSVSEVHNYYLQAGALLAVLYILKATDIHFENIIATNTSPVIIDVECIFSSILDTNNNVLNTAFLPFYVSFNKDGTPSDISGLGAFGTQSTGSITWKWENLNSDNISLERAKGQYTADTNQPILDGKAISPINYLKPIIQGFKEVCNWVIANKKVLCSVNSPLAFFKNRVIRVLPRPTQSYSHILENSYQPSALILENNRKNTIIDSLNQNSVLIPLTKTEEEELKRKELEIIEQMNIPLITANTSQKSIKVDDTIIADNYFRIPPYDAFIQNIFELNSAEIERQICIIEAAFAARYNLKTHSPFTHNNTPLPTIEEEIENIATTIQSNASEYKNTLTWEAFQAHHSNSKLHYGQLPSTLYDGKLGIALFFQTLYQVNKCEKYHTIANKIITDLVENINKSWMDSKDLSFSTGLSGMIYTLLKVDPINYQKEIISLVALISKDLILKDQTLDSIQGVSGCLSVLVEVFKQYQSIEVLKKCILIGEFLLSKRVHDKQTNCKVWLNPNIADIPLTGFAHGVSGIGLSLLRLWSVTGIDRYKSAFYEAMNYEDYFFDEKFSNWKDLRTPTNTYQLAWCYGAIGIGLVRTQAYELLKDARFIKDIENVIQVIKNTPKKNFDFYCCGNISRIDFLISANQIIKKKQLQDFIKSEIKALIKEKNKRGFYNTYENSEVSLENPSLFRGLSGIAYVYLRSLRPDTISCFGLQN